MPPNPRTTLCETRETLHMLRKAVFVRGGPGAGRQGISGAEIEQEIGGVYEAILDAIVRHEADMPE